MLCSATDCSATKKTQETILLFAVPGCIFPKQIFCVCVKILQVSRLSQMLKPIKLDVAIFWLPINIRVCIHVLPYLCLTAGLNWQNVSAGTFQDRVTVLLSATLTAISSMSFSIPPSLQALAIQDCPPPKSLT